MSDQIVRSELAGVVSKVQAAVGDRVETDDTLLILESMKMEIPVTAPCAGVVKAIAVAEGAMIAEGQILATLVR